MRPDLARPVQTWLWLGAIGPVVSLAIAGVLAVGGQLALALVFVLVTVVYAAVLVLVSRELARVVQAGAVPAAEVARRQPAPDPTPAPAPVPNGTPVAPRRTDPALLASMSHEIRTPLSAIVSLLELGRESGDAEARAEYAGLTEDAARNLMQVVDDVLDLSRIQAGKVDVDVRPADLVALVTDVVERARVRADARGLRVQWSGEVGSPIRRMDPARLGQALFNLLVHLVNATREGWVGLELAADGDRVTFEVRAGGLVSAEQPTSGLGPTIAAGVLELFGSTLVASTDPHGAFRYTFEIDLPVVGDESSELEPSVAVSLRPLRLLVAEDNPVNQLIIRRALEGMRHDVDIVGSGELALERAHLGYDAVLMDVRMPGLSGTDATRAIRARERVLGRPRVPIIALTASATSDQRDACLAAGMDAWLTKPLDRRRLTKALADLIDDEDEGSVRVGH